MIEGIEILNQIEIMKTPSWCFGLFFIALMSIIGSICIIAFSKKIRTMVIGLCLITLAFLLLLFSLIYLAPTGKYDYQVIIDDTVSATYLYENFEVIDQQGKIWTIRDKED